MKKSTILIAIIIAIGISIGIYYYISLPAGWYTNSYALKAGSNDVTFTQADIDACSSSHPTDVFSSIIDEVTYVMRYNSDTGLWDWYDFSDGTGPVTSIKAGIIYKVTVNNACTLLIG